MGKVSYHPSGPYTRPAAKRGQPVHCNIAVPLSDCFFFVYKWTILLNLNATSVQSFEGGKNFFGGVSRLNKVSPP